MTSLAHQLQSLALQGVALENDLHRRPSFLFDFHKAASLDRDEAHAIGMNGYEGLCSVDEIFEESSSLFDETAKHTERSMLTKKENDLLDKKISKFVRRIVPYFSLRAAHKCIEWLVYRFRVHYFNAEMLLFAFLPYHTSKLYSRLLQLFDKSFLDKRWPILNREIVPSKSVVLEQCMKDRSFFAKICENVSKSLKEFDPSSPDTLGLLRPAVNVFAIYSMEMIQNLKKNMNEFMATLMPHLVIGIKSAIPDYKAACYMIVTLMSSKMTITEEVLNSLINLISTDYQDSVLPKECLLTMVNLCQRQENIKKLPDATVRTLTESGRFIDDIQTLNRFNIERFVTLFMVKLVSMDSTVSKGKELLLKLVTTFQLSEHGQKLLITSVMETLANDEHDPAMLKVMLAAHKKYPNAVMNVVSRAGLLESSEQMKKVIDGLMTAAKEQEFSDCSFLSFSLNFDSVDEDVRLSSAMTLMQMLKDHPELSNTDFVQQSVTSRLRNENSPAVTALFLELLRANPDVFCQDFELVGETLISVVLKKRGQIEWNETSDAALEILLGERFANCSEEVSDLALFVLQDMMFYDSCVREKDVIRSLNIDSSILKKNNWVLTKNWKEGVASIVPVLMKTLIDSPDLILRFKTASQKISKLLATEMGCGNVVSESLPYKYLVNFAFLKGALSNVDNPKLVPTLLSVMQEIMIEIQCLFLQSIDSADSMASGWESEKKKLDFCSGLLELSSTFHDRKSTSSGAIAVLLKTLDEVYETLKSDKGFQCSTSYYSERTKMAVAAENLKGQNEIDADSASLIIKRDMCDFYVKALPFVNERLNDDIRTNFQSNMRLFLEVFFQDGEDVVQFLTNYWSCISRNASDLKLAISALHIANAVIAGKTKLRKKCLLSAESPFVPSLLGVLNQSDIVLRKCAMKCLNVLTNATACKGYLALVKCVCDNSAVILDDPDAIQHVLKQYFLSSSKPKVAVKNMMKDLVLHHITANDITSDVRAALLRVLKNSPSLDLTIAVMSELSDLLAKCSGKHVFNDNEVVFIEESIYRINPELLDRPAVKNVFWKALDCDQPIMSQAGPSSSPQYLCLSSIDKAFFNELDNIVKQDIIHKLVAIASSSKGSVDAIGKVFKNISLDATLVKCELENLFITDAEPAQKKIRLDEDQLRDRWQKSILLLEFIQEKKKITNVEALLPSLFQVLEMTLDENKASVITENLEYLRQLVLTLVLHLLKRMEKIHKGQKKFGEMIANACKIELVVHCVRLSSSTQTQHHALLLLSEMAAHFPEKVLHNLMSIFTFMGSHMLRQDDSYSLQVITKTMRVVIPVLTEKTGKAGANKEEAALHIVHAFVDSLPHIPPHRKIMVMHELLDTLGVSEYLWIIIVLMADLYVRKPVVADISDSVTMDDIDSQPSVLSIDSTAKICCDICEAEDLPVQISSIVKCMDYIVTLPFDVTGDVTRRSTAIKVVEIRSLSTLQLRKFYIAALTLLMNIVEQNQEKLSQTLKKSCSDNEMDDDSSFIGLLHNLYERVLQLVSKVTEDKKKDDVFSKFSKALITKCYGIMRSINSVLPIEISLNIFDVLLHKDDVFINCKALELLTEQLAAASESFTDHHVDLVARITEKVSALILTNVTSDESISDEQNTLCYTALASLKTAVRNFSKLKPEAFVKSMDDLCSALPHIKNIGNFHVCAAVFLCLAEMCSCLKAYCIPYLNKFIPALLQTVCLQTTLENETMLFSCVTLIHRILENLLDFSSSYLAKVVDKITALMLLERYAVAQDVESGDGTLSSRIGMRLKVIGNIISTKVPSRILVSVFTNVLDSDSGKSVTRISPLCTLILRHIQSLRKEVVTQTLPSVTALLYKLLEYQPESSDVTNVEDLTTDITVSAMLKLPENAFRSFFFGLSDWALTEEMDGRVSVYYQLMLKLSGKMKGLFSLFCGIVIENAAGILKGDNISQKSGLLKLVCLTLHSIFHHDNSNILTKERFEMLLQPLIDQLENVTDSDNNGDIIDVVQNDVIPLLGEVASEVADDTCQKLLNYQILLKSRHTSSTVRSLSLKAVEEVGNRMGAEYTMLLPESIPFLSELMEDDDEEVEAKCHAVIRSLEKAVGEPLQKYFNE